MNLIIENAPTLLAEIDEKLNCVCISEGWKFRLGILVVDGGKELTLADLCLVDEFRDLESKLGRVFSTNESLRDMPISLPGKLGQTQGFLTAWPLVSASGKAKSVCLSVICNTELEQSLDALRQLQSMHELILNAAGEGIYGLDTNGCITFGNAATQEILGWDPLGVVGRKSHEIHHHSHADGSPYSQAECPIYAALKDGEVHRVDNEVFWHVDGSPIPVEYTSTPIIHDGSIQGAVVVFRDISQRLEIEAQRKKAFVQIKDLKSQLELERDYLRDEIKTGSDFGEIIGSSPALRRTMAQIEAVSATPANVLILGESGVGKELIARAIHERSNRAEKPLVKINCASIPKELFESEFFGHVKGAFTGAHRDRIGRLQLADGGTIFLDEVGEIPLDLQGKLLRALQEREFERVGDDRTIMVNVRVVAATNRDLEAEVHAGRFREDLYYRLGVFPIVVPPLRDRSEDIADLAEHFLVRMCGDLGRETVHLSKHQVKMLKEYHWPGNIRELRNIIERALILSNGRRIRLDLAMPDAAKNYSAVESPDDSGFQHVDFLTDAELRERERANFVSALKAANGRVWGENGAARMLGIKPSTMAYRMKVLGISKII